MISKISAPRTAERAALSRLVASAVLAGTEVIAIHSEPSTRAKPKIWSSPLRPRARPRPSPSRSAVRTISDSASLAPTRPSSGTRISTLPMPSISETKLAAPAGACPSGGRRATSIAITIMPPIRPSASRRTAATGTTHRPLIGPRRSRPTVERPDCTTRSSIGAWAKFTRDPGSGIAVHTTSPSRRTVRAFAT